MRSLAYLGLSVVLAACAAAQTPESASSDDEVKGAPASAHADVQMNDVSIVLPIPKTQEELDHGMLSADGLIPKDVFLAASHLPAEPPAHLPVGSDVGMAYSTLRAVAFRVDPCFAQIGPVTDEAACDNQLRIIFQSMRTDGAIDGGVHAFYKLTRDELRGLLDDIVAARIANGGDRDLGPLQAHPIIAAQGLLGAASKALQGLVQKHASTKNFMRFTFFTSRNLSTVWNFSGFDVADGKATPMAIPTLPEGATTVTFFEGFAPNFGSGSFSPATTAKDNMQLLGNLGAAKAAPKADQEAAVDAAFALENPAKHSPNTIDCASCHMADLAKTVTSANLGLSTAGNKNAFAADARFVPAADMKQLHTPSLENGVNLHIFSYRGEELAIAPRVINETASVVAYLNGQK